MEKKIVAIGIVSLFFFGGIIPNISSEVNGESVTVMSAVLPTDRAYTSAIWDGEYTYIFGGGDSGSALDQILKYDTEMDNITIMNSILPSPRGGTSAIYYDSRAYVFGGNNGGSYFDEIVQYNISEDSLITKSSVLPSERSGTSAVWNGTHTFIFGGVNGWTNSDQILRYDPINDILDVMSELLPISCHGTSAIWDGQYAYIFGGWHWNAADDGYPLNTIVRYDPSIDNVTVLSDELPTGRFGTSATWDGECAYIFGGRADDTLGPDYDDIVIYTPSLNEITVTNITLPSERYYTSAIYNGTYSYIFGGKNTDYLDQIIEYGSPNTPPSQSSPAPPINLVATPDIWTNINSFTINWTNPFDEDGIKTGAWYKTGSPPQHNYDGIWTDSKSFSVSSSEGIETIYVWLEDNLGNINYLNYSTTKLYLDTEFYGFVSVNVNPTSWTNVNSFNISWQIPPFPFETSGYKNGTWYKVGSPPTSNYDGIWEESKSFTLTSIEGSQPVYFWLEDNAGNINLSYVTVEGLYLDTTAPGNPINLTATPDIWTNTNSFSIYWENPFEHSGVKHGCWYKIGSPPTSNSDGTWNGNRPITLTSYEGIHTIYIWLEDYVGNVNYLNYSTVDLYLDTIPPEIKETASYGNSFGEPITISAFIRYNNDVNSAVLYYRRTGESDWSNVSMTNIGNNYTAEIPESFVTMAGVDYYIEAMDGVNKAVFPSVGSHDVYFHIAVNDVNPPVISHTPVSNGTPGQSITISATIEDDVGVTGAVLFYRNKGASTWSFMAMIQDGNQYSANIPASEVTEFNMEYYIKATDGTFNTTHPGLNPNSSPHEIDIPQEAKEELAGLSYESSWFWLLLLLLIIVVLIVFLLSRRREEEVGVGVIPGEETSAIDPGESVYEEELEEPITEEAEITDLEEKPQEPKDTHLPEEGPETMEMGGESGTTPKPVPPLTETMMSDDEIFESIRKKYEEGKISQKTFEEIKKRYHKE